MKSKYIIHIYTGSGKGKTTAAFGLALRAIGAGKEVAIVQFMKKGGSSEIKAIKKYHLPIDICSFGEGFYKIKGDTKPKSTHKLAAQKALKKTQDIIKSGKYDLIVLDEINIACSLGLLDVDDVINVLNLRSIFNGSRSSVSGKRYSDIILTGRDAPTKLKKTADLITEMKKVKHYFESGLKARKGIEF